MLTELRNERKDRMKLREEKMKRISLLAVKPLVREKIEIVEK